MEVTSFDRNNLHLSEETIDEVFSEASSENLEQPAKTVHEIEMQSFNKLLQKNMAWESGALSTMQGYMYSLIIRPNGLRYTKGFNKCMGVWLKPLQGEKDKSLDWPAKVKLTLRIRSFGDETNCSDLVTTRECKWKIEDTKSINPVLNFDLMALKLCAIQDPSRGCIIHRENEDASVIIIIEEDEK